MSKLLIVLACLVGMTTAGIAWDRLNLMTGLDRNRMEQVGGESDRLVSMTQDELRRQKFLLDILMQVQQPLVNLELLEMGKSLIVDQDKYQGQIDDEMLHIFELCRNQRQLGRQDTYTIADDDHLRQMIGLYRLFVRSRDWDTFQRNVCWARNQVNEMLFVNSLLLAVRDRQDTRNMIMPAIHEILPERFYGQSLVRKAQTIDTSAMNTQQDSETTKPSLFDMIGMNRRQQLSEQQLGMLDRHQLWMPWREMRMEMAMRRTNGEPIRTTMRQEDKLVLPVEERDMEAGMTTLLTTDVGMNDLVHNFINELVVQEREVQKDEDIRTEQRLGRVELRRDMGRTDRWMDQRQRSDLDDDDDDNEMRRMRMRGTTDKDDKDRILRVGRRRQNRIMENEDGDDDVRMQTGDRWMERGRVIVDGRRIVDQREDILQRQRQQDLLRTRSIDRLQDRLGERRQDDLPTTTIDDDRLLYVNRRHLQDMDMMNRERQTDLNNQRDRFLNIVRGSRISDGRRTIDNDQEMDRDMDTDMWRRNKYTRDDDSQRWNQRVVDDDRRIDRDQEMREMRLGNRRQQKRVDDWAQRRRENRMDDFDLPTTKINDERLLYVNRRHLNSMTRDNDNDNDDDWSYMRDYENLRQRVGDKRRMMWDDREQQLRGQRRMNDERDDDTMRWQRMEPVGNDRILRTSRRRQQMNIENQRDRFMDMVRVGIRDGRKILDRGDDEPVIMRQRSDDDRMLYKNNRRRYGRIGRDYSDDDDDDVRRMQWNRRQQLGDNQWEQNRMDLGKRNDRLLLSSRQRMRLNDDNNMRDEDRTTRRRVPRSLRSDFDTMQRRNTLDIRSGEQLLQNLQQLIARINLERIALRITDRDTDRLMQRGMNNQRLAQEAVDERLALRLNDMRLDTQRNRRNLEYINRVEERLRQVFDQQLRSATLDNQDDVNRVMGEVLMGRGRDGGLLQIMRELFMLGRDTQTDGEWRSATLREAILRCPVMQYLLRRIVRIVDMQRQQLGSYRRDDIVLDGVRINDVSVDHLRTMVELDDSDLVNLLHQRVTQQLQGREQMMQKMLVARQQRLNHKDFRVNIDLTADRDQRVVIRTMLLPKIDGEDRALTLDEARLNGLLLDATIVDLRSGRNTISRRSRDITWTSRDTTPLTEIYRRVMNALEDKRVMEMEPIVGNNCRLPHRLLLPRGRVEGLPMQLLVIVTPVRDDLRNTQEDMRDNDMCRIGALTRNMDRLPLTFPLDRMIRDANEFINIPNLHLMDVAIYHDDKVSNRNVF